MTFSTTAFARGFVGSAYEIDGRVRDGLAVMFWGGGKLLSALTSKQAVRCYRMGYHLVLATVFTLVALVEWLIEVNTVTPPPVEAMEVEATDIAVKRPTAEQVDEARELMVASLATVEVEEVTAEQYTRRELLAIAKEVKLPRYSRLNKDELFTRLLEEGHLS